MKKILIACLMTLSLTTTAQIKISDTPKADRIGEFKQLGESYVEINKMNNTCQFTYKDVKFIKVDSYKTFYFSYEDLDTLYMMFTNFEGIEKNTEKMVELEDGGKLYFTYKKQLGQMFADVVHIDNAGVTGKIRYMTEKQLKKLFGKE